MIGIIGAMEEEIHAIKDILENVQEVSYYNRQFWVGKLGSKEVVLGLVGVGKVASALSTTIMISNFDVSEIINIGTMGGVPSKDLSHGDLVIGSELGYSDVEIPGHPYGEMSKCPRFFNSDYALVKKMLMVSKEFKQGVILSSDKFCTDQKYIIDLVNKEFKEKNILGVDMESAAIAQVCYFLNKKFIVLRYVSDIIGETNQEVTFEENVRESSAKIAKILSRYVLIGD